VIVFGGAQARSGARVRDEEVEQSEKRSSGTAIDQKAPTPAEIDDREAPMQRRNETLENLACGIEILRTQRPFAERNQ